MDPLEWLARLADHIPDAGKHRTRLGALLDHLGLSPPGQEEPAPTPKVVRVPVDEEGREILAG